MGIWDDDMDGYQSNLRAQLLLIESELCGQLKEPTTSKSTDE